MRLKQSFYLLVLMSGMAQAGDVHTLSRVIFLPKSAAVLAVDEGYHDSSGFPFVEFTVLDTRTGETLWHAAQHPQAEGEVAPLREKWFNNYTSKMKQNFDLSAAAFAKAHFSKPRYQWPEPEIVPIGPWGESKVNVRLWKGAVPIVIKATPSGEKCPNYVYWKPQSYTLYVNGQKLAAGKHHCAMGYSLSRVDIKGNHALIAINAFTTGFEGPNNEQLLFAFSLRSGY